MKAEHPSKTDCHIGVSGEIKKYLQCISDSSKPCEGDRQLASMKDKRPICDQGKVIGKQNLLTEAFQETAYALGKIIKTLLSSHNLISNDRISENRSRYKLREENDIEANMEQIFLHLSFSPVDIDDVGNGVEREKGNPNRQYDFGDGKVRTEQMVDIRYGKHEIFEYVKDAQVEYNHHKNDQFGTGQIFSVTVNQQAEHPIDHNGKHQEQYKFRLSPSIKAKACD